MKSAPWIIIIVLMALLFLQRECTPEPDCDPCPDPDTITLVKYDTIIKAMVEYVPQIHYHDKFIHDTLPIDTPAVVAAYLENNYYIDTLAHDSSVLIIVEDSVNKNRIIWRRKHIEIYPATIYKTSIVTKQADPLRKLFVGVGVGRNQKQFGLAPSLMYISRKETAYSLSFDVINKDIYFAVYWKINFNRKQ